MDLAIDAAVIGVVPGIVEVAKRAGMPVRFAGIAAIIAATVLIALSELGHTSGDIGLVAGWVLRGVVTGLAASGLFSQATRIRTSG